MSALTNAGRAAIAKAIKDRLLMLAWGTGQSWWDSTITNNFTFGTSGGNANKITLPYVPYAGDPSISRPDVSVSTVNWDGAGAGTLYTKGTDYTIDYATGVVTRVISGAIANGGAVKVTFQAKRPEADVARTALFAEVGRHKMTSAQFVTPDNAGSITVTNGRFNPSNTPTNYLYLQFQFDYTDGQGFTIRELGVFMDTVVDPALPSGQLYFVPSNITDPGILLLLQNIPPLERQVATRQTIAVVVDF